MAVYKRTFTTYTGPLTGERFRFVILARYAFRALFESRLAASYLTACMFPHLVALLFIYLRNNLDALSSLGGGFQGAQLFGAIAIDGTFFARLLTLESWLTFMAIAMIGPGLVSPDLANNALSFYLSRPLSKPEYVAGKLATLVALASVLTWIPALLLALVQISLGGLDWFTDQPRIVFGIVAGSWLWILTVSLVALAISAWVRWRPVATASLFGVFFVGAALGEVANNILSLDPRWGMLLSLRATMAMIWEWLLMGENVYYGSGGAEGIPAWTGVASMLAACGLSIWLLSRRIRAAEVVRG